MSKNQKIIFLIIVGCVITIIDQVTKYIVRTKMNLYDSKEVISNFFSFTYLRNPGGAFGLLADSPEVFRFYFFIVTSILALFVFLFIFIKKASESDYLFMSSMTLVIGGAAGNIIDRIRFGEVVDFLDFYIGKHHWPPFNVADSAITVGMVIFLVHSWKDRESSQEKKIMSDAI